MKKETKNTHLKLMCLNALNFETKFDFLKFCIGHYGVHTLSKNYFRTLNHNGLLAS